MKSVYIDSSIAEKLAKEQFKIPANVMMENAAAALETAVFELAKITPQEKHCSFPKVLIACGSGNNGGDGFALARRLFGKAEVYVLVLAEPKTEDAKVQFECIKALGIPILKEDEFLQNISNSVIVDCIFGTGFHGNLPENILALIKKLNSANAKRIACDISSGLEFNADLTVTMGALKTALFSDKAKAVSGKIILADLGIGCSTFEKITPPDGFLVEKEDVKLPWRTTKSAHKGNYGHLCVVAGEKAGAGIISASAALNFGAGLVTVLKTKKSNLEQFKISPELMISDLEKIPEKTSAITIGSGLGNPSPEILERFITWFESAKNPACVIDADLFSFPGISDFLEKLNSVPEARIILTPHLKEFSFLCKFCNLGDFTVSELSDDLNLRIDLGNQFCQKFKNIVVVIKSSNTLICSYNRGLSPLNIPAESSQFFILTDGTPSLAKAGSGDVLAGMCGALLAQGYNAIDAAITGAEVHALAGASFDEGKGFDLTPLKLIKYE